MRSLDRSSRTRELPWSGWSSLLIATCLLYFLASAASFAQPLPRNGLRVEAGTGIGPTVRLHQGSVESVHRRQHYFTSLTFQRHVGQRTTFGAGLRLSWGTYGVSVRGTYSDSTGSYDLTDAIQSRIVWYPFANHSTPRPWGTDPLQFWLEGSQRICELSPNSVITLHALMGAMPPNGIYLSVETDARLNASAAKEPFRASTSWGDRWNGFVGFGLDWCFRLRLKDQFSAGAEWRSTLGGYFDHELVMDPLAPKPERVLKRVAYAWIGLRLGYTFGWGGVTRIPITARPE